MKNHELKLVKYEKTAGFEITRTAVFTMKVEDNNILDMSEIELFVNFAKYMDESIALEAYWYDKDIKWYEPFSNLTVNLSGYGYSLKPNEVFIPKGGTIEYIEILKKADLIENIIAEVPYGSFDSAAYKCQLKTEKIPSSLK